MLRKERPLNLRLERGLGSGDQDHGDQGEGQRGAHHDSGLLGGERLRQDPDAHAPWNQDERRGEREAHALAYDVVHVHEPVPRDRVRHDAHGEDVPEAAEGIHADAVEGEDVGQDERRLHDRGQEPELRLHPLPRRCRSAVGVPGTLERERHAGRDVRRHQGVEPRRLDVPAPFVPAHAVDEVAVEVQCREQPGDGVGAHQESGPEPAARFGLYQRGVEEGHGSEAHADAEELAPPLGGESVREVVEREDVEVPEDGVEDQPHEDAERALPHAAAEDEQADDRIGHRRDQRDHPVMLHGYDDCPGRPGESQGRADVNWGAPLDGS